MRARADLVEDRGKALLHLLVDPVARRNGPADDQSSRRPQHAARFRQHVAPARACGRTPGSADGSETRIGKPQPDPVRLYQPRRAALRERTQLANERSTPT